MRDRKIDNIYIYKDKIILKRRGNESQIVKVKIVFIVMLAEYGFYQGTHTNYNHNDFTTRTD